MKTIILLAGAAAFAFTAPAVAKPGHGHGNQGYSAAGPVGYGAGGCPPGLARKGCIPPGQAKKMFNVGQRLPRGFATPYGFNQIPYNVRSQYGLSPNGNYYYGDGYLYRVNPRTMLVQQVVAALLR
jgi:hypothetical protein